MDVASFINVGKEALDLAKDWQTLIAGLVAIWAGWLAFRGARIQADATTQTAATAHDRRRHAFARAVGLAAGRLKAAAEKATAVANVAMSHPETFYDHQPYMLTWDPLFECDWETMSLLAIEHQEFVASLCDQVGRHNGWLYQTLVANAAQKERSDQAAGLLRIRDETVRSLGQIAERCDELDGLLSSFMASLREHR